MSITTLYQISNYYEAYRDEEITLNSYNIKALRFVPKHILLKCKDSISPCRINSTSMERASVLLTSDNDIIHVIEETMLVSLKYCFLDDDTNPIVFFVNAQVENIAPYNSSSNFKILNLKFTKRPSDDLILRLGVFIEINKNFEKYKYENIHLSVTAMRELNMEQTESYASIQGVPRKCIIKSISFGGASIVSVGLPKYLIGDKIKLYFSFSDTYEDISISGVIRNAAFIEGRQDICKIDVNYNQDDIPIAYKFHINRYLVSNKIAK